MNTENITVNGITYKMIGKAEVKNIGAPAEAVCAWYCIRADEEVDAFGCKSLYEFRYNIPSVPEESCVEWYDLIDWETPDDIVEAPYMWLEAEQRMV